VSGPAATQARELLGRQRNGPVISLFLDLEPDQFATAPARATQARSLLDRARREQRTHSGFSHSEQVSIGESIDRIQEYLASSEPPVSGARALAIFCAGTQWFEAIALARPVAPDVVIAETPHVEPLLAGLDSETWCVALVSRRALRLFAGPPAALREVAEFEDEVHGQHRQGGWSQANYERSLEKDVDDHLRDAAHTLYRRWQVRGFDVLVLGGPEETVARLAQALPSELREPWLDRRLELDVTASTEDDVREALAPLLQERSHAAQSATLRRILEQRAVDGRAVTGPEPTLRALLERRVQTLVLAPDFDLEGARCPSCGLITTQPLSQCQVDGSELTPLDSVREAAIEAAIEQDAEVTVVTELVEHAELPRLEGIAALLRF
jgi:peptide chain release factor subunit 1